MLFLIVGGLNTVFSTVLFAALVILLGPRVPSTVSLCISWLVSLLLVFSAYRRWVFKVKGRWLKDLMRFAGVNLVALLANAFALTALVELAGLPPIPVQVAITVLIVVFNYVGHKYFSFRRTRG
ncbi:GtrA family protein [Frateuria soli]|uniref:GtrA family protein n=1 Tax=Frateuria soli TaxID=1542730 RepID=UPI001E364C77|nr:GtrA family protein [Frateuria soli]UGB37561.1 GtrA family protein [Frateuria soli]